MTTVNLSDLRTAADGLWPEHSAEPWDRVGLVSGEPTQVVRRVLLAVDAVSETIDEAIACGADVLLTHHPLLLRGVHTMAEDTAKGALIAKLIRARCALLTAHTNADAPANGVSDVFAQALDLREIRPIVASQHADAGIGRVGVLDSRITLEAFARRIAHALPSTVSGVRVAGDPERLVQRVALCGGAGDSLLDHELVRGADVYVTSDLRHHPAQESVESAQVTGGPALIDVSHWASESLWLERAAEQLGRALPGVEFRVSARRTDPWVFSVGAEHAAGA